MAASPGMLPPPRRHPPVPPSSGGAPGLTCCGHCPKGRVSRRGRAPVGGGPHRLSVALARASTFSTHRLIGRSPGVWSVAPAPRPSTSPGWRAAPHPEHVLHAARHRVSRDRAEPDRPQRMVRRSRRTRADRPGGQPPPRPDHSRPLERRAGPARRRALREVPTPRRDTGRSAQDPQSDTSCSAMRTKAGGAETPSGWKAAQRPGRDHCVDRSRRNAGASACDAH